MNIFEKYASNTLASNGNQTFMKRNKGARPSTGLVFLKVFKGGKFNYVFGFSDVIDSTFADGSVSRSNDVCPWKIEALEAASADECEPKSAFKNGFKPVTFSGKGSADITGEKITFSDPVSLEADKYICLKITFSGRKVPYHPESQIRMFRKSGIGWKYSQEVPVPIFTGVERSVEKRIAFMGDSITQGIGATFNSYRHYAAVVSEILGDKYSFWDLGIGYARGADAATDGAWLARAKENDIVTVCYGVNDMFQGRTVEQIKADLETIVLKLKEAETKVIIQTVPPFDYDEAHAKMWREINAFIRTVLQPKADGFFDTVDILCTDGEKTGKAIYGGHPNDEGHRLWGEAIAKVINS